MRDDRVPLSGLFKRLPDEMRDVARAEFALYRAEAIRRAFAGGWAIGLGVVALALASGALIAGLVGAIVWLGQAWGLGWAILTVVGVTLAVSALLAMVAVSKAKRTFEPELRS